MFKKHFNGTSIKLLPLALMVMTNTHISHSSSANKVSYPPLLLSKDYQAQSNTQQFYISEKLDGVRAFWNGKQLITRGGNIINSPGWFTKGFPSNALDGELWIKRGAFSKVSGIIRRKSPTDQDWLKVKYMVFDLPQSLSTFEKRYQELSSLISANDSPYLKLVLQKSLPPKLALKDYLTTITAKGGEGLMLHKKSALYQAKRSNDLQKLKLFNDAEATVIGYTEGKGKYQGLIGAIEVLNDDGIIFKIGSGFTLVERASPPKLNSRITYRYRGKTVKNTPRFATFLRVKNDH
jgi:DNA ligase-1